MSPLAAWTWLRDRPGLILSVYWIAWATATHWPGFDVRPADVVGIAHDKWIHFGANVLLTTLLVLASPLGKHRPRGHHVVLAAIMAIAYAWIDELTQDWVPGRSFDPVDVIANLSGVLAVAATLLLWDRRLGWWAGARWFWRLSLLAVLPVLLLMALDRNLVPAFFGGYYNILGIHARGDQLTHFAAAAVITLWVMAARPLGSRRAWGNLLLVTFVLMAAGPAIEYLQEAHFNRRSERGDLMAHLYGVALAVTGWIIASLICQGVRGVYAHWRQRRQGKQAAVDHLAAASRADRGAEASSEQVADEDQAAAIATELASRDRGSTSGRFVGHAMLVSALTLVSRFSGLLRDAAVANLLGGGAIASAFWFAFVIPNLFRRLFGEGALSAAFIPIYSRLKADQPQLARRFVLACLAMLTVVLGLIMLAGLGALHLLRTQWDWSAQTSLSLRLMMIMLPFMPLICLVALIGATLQVHRRFGPPAAAPLLLNATMIGAAAGVSFGFQWWTRPQWAAVVIAWSVVFAGLMQLYWQWHAVAVHLKRDPSAPWVRLGAAWRSVKAPLRKLVLVMGPMLLGLAVFQFNTLLDNVLAFGLRQGSHPDTPLHLLGFTFTPPVEAGAVSWLNYAQRLYQFPLGVFGIALATAIFPALAEAAARRGRDPDDPQFSSTLAQGLRLSLFIGLPAGVGLYLVGLPLTRMIFESGRFSLDHAYQVSELLAAYALAIWAYSATHVLTRAFYALDNAITPVKVSAAMVGLNLTLNLLLIWPLGAVGLALATAISAMVQTVVLAVLLHRRAGGVIDRALLISVAWTLVITGVMAVAVYPWTRYFDLNDLTKWQTLGWLAAAVGTGCVAFAAGAMAAGRPELTWLLRRRLR